MLVLALHLPQYHDVPENNEWWGQGFTEWVNVRGAKPLYHGHQQPLHPLNDNYYDLTDPDALRWQAELARRYGIDGFVFFHYWYAGKQLLERPVQLWRDTPDAGRSYALCWANHPWTRSWDGKEHDILLAQTYGDIEDWDAHLDYLRSHFEDPRYIRRDGRPVFFIYNTSNIPEVDAMLHHWEARMRASGDPGLFVVEYISSKNRVPSAMASAAVYEDEPAYSLRFEISAAAKTRRILLKRLKIPEYQDYDRVWRRILRKRRRYNGREIIQGAFVAWDNSPRRGTRGPMIVRGSSPVKFGRYFEDLLKADRPDASNDFVVINAWNEWGEGAVLEPSVEHGYGYLEAVAAARSKLNVSVR